MAQRNFRFQDYTVGWVCALPIELAAAAELLDEEHRDPPQDPNDTNLYTLGRIGEHNTVIACLPAGQIGPGAAAAVAIQMKSKFTAIRFSLMVGIGGGVPSSSSDVRLGDVVISQPFMEHGGVVQYDSGKTNPSGFTRTGSLNAPPIILLNALSKLTANKYRGRSNLSAYLSTITRLPHFAYEKAGSDILFKSAYNHAEGPTCDGCDKDNTVQRAARGSQEILVHRGTIASGNQVIKDGVTRDRLSGELGGILCFEMEAAGLMNNFPCLVIRGICDYADSHKNKCWQPYAAATAAACAKEIMSIIPASEVTKARTIDDAIKGREGQANIQHSISTLPFDQDKGSVASAIRPDNSQLFSTVYNGYKAVKRLLEKGADPNAKKDDGWAVLHEAVRKRDRPVVQLLLENKADPNAEKDDGWSVLREAVHQRDQPIVQLLLENGADANPDIGIGYTTLREAVYQKHEPIVRLLLEKGADPDADTGTGLTALHEAVHQKDEKIVRLLLEIGADPNAKKYDGWTVLHSAVQAQDELIVRLLLEKGADPNAKKDDGWSVLREAVHKRDKPIVQLLLEKGAEPYADTGKGWTALDEARYQKDEQILQLLQESKLRTFVE